MRKQPYEYPEEVHSRHREQQGPRPRGNSEFEGFEVEIEGEWV